MTDNADPLQTLRAISLCGPANAATWAAAAAALMNQTDEDFTEQDALHLLESVLPPCRLRGFWPEVLRAMLAMGAGRPPPPPVDWSLPTPSPGRRTRRQQKTER